MNPYLDEATGVPFNRLGLTDPVQLKAVEYAITDLKVAVLAVDPIRGSFDLDHLKQIHHHIFKDIYDWAGKERTLNMGKRDPDNPGWRSRFAAYQDIPALAESVKTDLDKWNHFKGLNREDFAAGAAAVYVKLNFMHPFPEGNGRSTQAMLSQLANEAGYALNFSKLDRHAWNVAAARSMPQHNLKEPALTRPGDTRLIEAAFDKIVEPQRVLSPTRGPER